SESGINPDDIEQIVAGGTSNGNQYIAAVKSKKAIDIKDLLKGSDFKGKKIKEVKVGKYTVHEVEGGGAAPGAGAPFGQPGQTEAMAACVPESNIAIMGPAKTVRAVLERGKKAQLSDALQAALNKTDLNQAVAFAIDAKSAMSSVPMM